MANGTKFFWLKLHRDFFKKHYTLIIGNMKPNGQLYLMCYIKMLTEAIDHDGRLRYSDEIPYTDDILSSVIMMDSDIVHKSLEIFESLRLIKYEDDGTIVMTKMGDMIGYETDYAVKKRHYRDNVPQSEDNVPQNGDNVPFCRDNVRQEIRDKSIDKKNIKKKNSFNKFESKENEYDDFIKGIEEGS